MIEMHLNRLLYIFPVILVDFEIGTMTVETECPSLR